MKYILALSILISTPGFAYIYADKGDRDLDSLSRRMEQQDIENRLDAIESRQHQEESDRWEKSMSDSIKNR